MQNAAFSGDVAVMMWELPSIEVKRVERISPSSFQLFKKCPLRGIFASTRVPRFLPSSPQAYLGSIMHSILERAEKGKLNSEIDFEEQWAEVVKKIECIIQGSWMERHFIPLESSVPKYYLKKSQCKLLALKIARDAPKWLHRSGEAREKLLMHSNDGLIAGKPDSIIPTENGDIIADYKTGHVLEMNSGKSVAIDETYEIQLLLYAYLYHCSTGSWPYALRIIGLDGKQHDLPYSPEKCIKVFDEVKRTVDSINSIIESYSSNSEKMRYLASPKPQSCCLCPYRPICNEYWMARGKNEAQWPLDFKGRITEKKVLGNGLLLVNAVSPENIRISIRGLKPSRHPALEYEKGQLSFFSLKLDKVTNHYREGPYTTIYIQN